MAGDLIPIRAKLAHLSCAEAERWVRTCVLAKGVWQSNHLQEKMEERDISMRQVQEVLNSGRVTKKPYWDEEHEDWVCELRKRVAGRDITVIVGLETKNELTIITTYG